MQIKSAWKNAKRKGAEMLPYVLLNVGTSLMLISIALYFIGFHSVDLSYNLENIQADMNMFQQKCDSNWTLSDEIRYVDIGSDFKARDLPTWYIIGHNQQRMSIVLGISGGMIWGMGYSNLCVKKQWWVKR